MLSQIPSCWQKILAASGMHLEPASCHPPNQSSRRGCSPCHGFASASKPCFIYLIVGQIDLCNSTKHCSNEHHDDFNCFQVRDLGWGRGLSPCCEASTNGFEIGVAAGRPTVQVLAVGSPWKPMLDSQHGGGSLWAWTARLLVLSPGGPRVLEDAEDKA